MTVNCEKLKSRAVGLPLFIVVTVGAWGGVLADPGEAVDPLICEAEKSIPKGASFELCADLFASSPAVEGGAGRRRRRQRGPRFRLGFRSVGPLPRSAPQRSSD